MGKSTNIAWCDHTFSPWWGCVKVSRGCEHCYMQTFLKRVGQERYFGPSKTTPRRFFSDKHWLEPLKWDREAEAAGVRRRVFCASMADVFEDNPALVDERVRLFRLIESTPSLDWLVLTKRPGNILPQIRQAIEAIDSWVSIGYNQSDAAPTERDGSDPGRSIGGIGDRQRGPCLAGEEANIRPVDRRHKDDSLSASTSGNHQRSGLPTGPRDERGQAGLCGGSPPGLDALIRANSTGGDHQPCGREHGKQPTGQPGVSNLQRAEVALSPSPGSRALGLPRRESPEDLVDRSSGGADSQPAAKRRNGEGNRRSLFDESQSDQRDLLPSHLDASSLASTRAWLARWPAGDPPRNVWLGTSVEDQRAADERIPLLLQTPAAVRFLSCEPLLGPIELFDTSEGVLRGVAVIRSGGQSHDGPSGPSEWFDDSYSGIDWVIAGGESGLNYRPMDLDWARSLRDQCTSAGVSYFFKQIGGRTHAAGGRLLDGREWSEFPEPAREAASAGR